MEGSTGGSPLELSDDELQAEIEACLLADFEFEDAVAVPLKPSLLNVEKELDRGLLSLSSGLAVIVASCIGGGIFASPGIVFGYVSSVGAALFVWILGGLLAMTGAMCYAELGAMMPESGGDFTYLLRAFGPLAAFLFAFTGIILSRPGSTAIIALTLADYFCRLIGWTGLVQAKLVAICVLLGICALNVLSSKIAIAAQNSLAILKVLSLVIISITGLVYLNSVSAHSYSSAQRYAQIPRDIFVNSSTNLGDYALATYSALWAYDGWNSLNLVTGEMKEPEKNLPRAVIGGPLIVMGCYVFTNLSYFAVLSPSLVRDSTAIAVDFGKVAFGDMGSIVIPFIVMISCLSAIHASVFAGSRVIWVSPFILITVGIR